MIIKGKICLITGATSGIGKAAARLLAKEGAHLIIHGRDAAKTEATKHEIIQDTGNEQIDVVTGDLSLLSAVRKIGDHIRTHYSHLDVLINNAGGLMQEQRTLTKEGHEKTIALNFLSAFLLTALLFDLLRSSPQARIINTASQLYAWAKPDWQDFNMARKYSSLRAYANSKLYLVLFTMELDKRLKAAGIQNIVATAFHPGTVSTNIASGTNSFLFRSIALFRWLMLSPEKGADTLLYLATTDEAIQCGGWFLMRRKRILIKKKFLLPQQTTQLWKIAEAATGVTFTFS